MQFRLRDNRYTKNLDCGHRTLLSYHGRGENCFERQRFSRVEVEITYVNRVYIDRSDLDAQVIARGFVWLDTDTR